MTLDRNAVTRHAGRHIRDMQMTRYLTDKQRRAIRKFHEQIAEEVARKARK